MGCKEIVRRLSDLLEGALEPAVFDRLSRHLEHCEHCRAIVDTTRHTIRFYCNTEPLPLPDDVLGRLDRALADKLTRR